MFYLIEYVFKNIIVHLKLNPYFFYEAMILSNHYGTKK